MLKINVGLSRKVTQDYNSKGYSLNIEAELPGDVVNDPESLARKADGLFALADRLLEDQIRKSTPGTPEVGRPTNGNGNGESRREQPSRNNGGFNGHRENPRNGVRLLTAAQGRAIQVMARKLDTDPDDLARQEFGAGGVGELTVKQASAFIDLLKKDLDQKQASQGVSR